ncbi:MAG: phosphoenolpyruvate synthase [Candidatus Nealsonbacteria bacterium RIFCSPHIGHO2_01_FULL_43_31]|uniref:Phosphoenolpyruvate synthase n=2 Tax=Candidatus Nealsoniibacteriota TaxID=1817911 RepID=A0A1G2E6T3_9BACT|nr:MAG: phosphoenolpyruvate synthase [Parcubacteria group bacterium GW2011_GWB1_43_6]OGZ20766.1 MAG: phosphoenolpyruvate synthase [Candidatus Nealsonbacteria bacterium RIFCSPHIGHO2_01_FULL_43_31]OGZ21332.1 MAG: phosphoenolpyruvate synthase [Candidatus Nealsonbacteria bacterium RIFCSPHIGHO2_02_FULL_43_13]OGZ24212.1 MAG: phosphoenolpyruvate synthase [Candidatus Nealsonbacteria bacterium RIFCSPLOWO2_01_FULL_43_36]
MKSEKYILPFEEISSKDVPLVGGKNASLGEMISQLAQKGINVPDGFALTTAAYWRYLKANQIDGKLKEIFADFNPKKIESLQKVGKASRALIMRGKMPDDLKEEISRAYQLLGQKYGKNPTVAVRTSGVAEDTATASFAGQFETYLNVTGEQNILEAVRKSIASTFTDRAIAYREEKGFSQLKLGLSVGVQKMIRSDLASSGIIFTIDTESGFKDVIVVNSIFGVGEMIVKGKITPDQFTVFKSTLEQGFKPIIAKNLGRKEKKYIFSKGGGLKEAAVSKADQSKFSLNDEEVLKLARWASIIEKHYGREQDIEWAKDGQTGKLFIVQSRPETVYETQTKKVYEEYELKTTKTPIITGIAVGNKIGQGKIRVIENVAKINEFQQGEILVTKMTDPDWVPIMRLASAIVTDEGSRVCHAAIVSRELGIPAIVGTDKAAKVLKTGQMATVDCSSGTGRVYLGTIPFKIKKYNLENIPETKTKIMMNVGSPEIAFKNSFLPNKGVGLAREEFIIASKINAHPLALIKQNKSQFFVDELARGIGQIACAFWPNPAIVRFSDFKTNEYATLPGGQEFEPKESNPMIGWRGASRYYDPKYKKAFILECQALKKAREEFGLKNIWAMVPFCRTIEEGRKVLAIMAGAGLEKGKDGLKVIVMCEIPSNVVLAEKFLQIFDGMSIGSNDLTQLALGIDRDNAQIAQIGDERNEVVKHMIARVISICKQKKKYCGICGQAPSDFPDFAEFLVEQGIESISLNPDTVIKTTLLIAQKEKQLKLRDSK